MTDAYNKIQDRLFDGIKIDVDGKIDNAAAREWAEGEILQLYEALDDIVEYLTAEDPDGRPLRMRTADGVTALAKARGDA